MYTVAAPRNRSSRRPVGRSPNAATTVSVHTTATSRFDWFVKYPKKSQNTKSSRSAPCRSVTTAATATTATTSRRLFTKVRTPQR
ncbi:hypothetical protein [Curtobacterium sp. MCJR17_043]|uniref:hypothetical protein n=1 Tax=Curtobacterium sp. MCJR17_043 TaxID=2175660 RepID=UPI0024E030B8|nr:hypothetical protein [Curtobacterium sp. MCJR17_043]WIB37204.1 hypothetical protein DEJ15_13865 [Curtobacterium sp. MCJR17_043]